MSTMQFIYYLTPVGLCVWGGEGSALGYLQNVKFNFLTLDLGSIYLSLSAGLIISCQPYNSCCADYLMSTLLLGRSSYVNPTAGSIISCQPCGWADHLMSSQQLGRSPHVNTASRPIISCQHC